jgi:hypothetical protein
LADVLKGVLLTAVYDEATPTAYDPCPARPRRPIHWYRRPPYGVLARDRVRDPATS